MFRDRKLSVRAGAVAAWGELNDSDFARMLKAAGEQLGFDIDTPVARLGADAVRVLLYGDPHRKLSMGNGLQGAYRGLLHPIDEFIRTSKRFKKMLREVPLLGLRG